MNNRFSKSDYNAGLSQVAIEENTTLKCYPTVSLVYSNDMFCVEVFAPGYKKEDFVITVYDRLLNISVETGDFKRTVKIPSYVDAETISSRFSSSYLKLYFQAKKV